MNAALRSLWLAPGVRADVSARRLEDGCAAVAIDVCGNDAAAAPADAAGFFLEVEGFPRIAPSGMALAQPGPAGWRLGPLVFILTAEVLDDLRRGALIGLGRTLDGQPPWAGALRSAQRAALLNDLEGP